MGDEKLGYETRDNAIREVRMCEVIEITFIRGEGTENDPVREVKVYYDKFTNEKLAERDPRRGTGPTTRNAVVKSRCPACNPLHGGTTRTIPGRRKSPQVCILCAGERMVDVEVSVRYVDALREMPHDTFRVVGVLSDVQTLDARFGPRSRRG